MTAFFLSGSAACSEAAHCSMFSLLLVASSHESNGHLVKVRATARARARAGVSARVGVRVRGRRDT